MSEEISSDELAEYKKYIEESDGFQVTDDILVHSEQRRLKNQISEIVDVINEHLNCALNKYLFEVEHDANKLIEHKTKIENETADVINNEKKLIKDIKNLETKSKAVKNELQTVIIDTRNALKDYLKILDCYSAAFNFKVKILNSTEKRHKFELAFKEAPDKPVLFDIDAKTMDLIDFDASSFCSRKEEKHIKDNYKKQSNVQALIQDLRELLLSKITKS